MSDLLPCPFCGGEAVKVDGFTVACAHGLCIGWTVRRASPHEWNTRAFPAVQPAHVNETPKSEHDAANVLTLTAERDRLREALWAILACETPNANATVTRMASITKAALKGEGHD